MYLHVSMFHIDFVFRLIQAYCVHTHTVLSTVNIYAVPWYTTILEQVSYVHHPHPLARSITRDGVYLFATVWYGPPGTGWAV